MQFDSVNRQLKEQFVAAEIVGDGDGDEDCSTS
jgi:hypothetical protein